MNENKKLMKKLAKKCHAFLASEIAKVNETKSIVKFQLKTVLCMSFVVGNCAMEEKQVSGSSQKNCFSL
ncbi:hypothetical protein AMTRI_Chr01g130710 [Amborella trichopoda]